MKSAGEAGNPEIFDFSYHLSLSSPFNGRMEKGQALWKCSCNRLDAPGGFGLSNLEEMRHEKNSKGFFEVRQRSIRRIQQDSSNSGSAVEEL
jgi:hypothetical protein